MADTECVMGKTECAEETLEKDKQPECAKETVEEDKESTSEGIYTKTTDTEEGETVHTYPSRYRKWTVKGQLFKIEKRKYEFNFCLNKWRKQCNRLPILFTEKQTLK